MGQVSGAPLHHPQPPQERGGDLVGDAEALLGGETPRNGYAIYDDNVQHPTKFTLLH